MDIVAEIRALHVAVLDINRRLTKAGGGVHAREHGPGHQSGGDDELDVTGLSGVLADPQLVDVDPAGALDGDSATTPLAVRVDGTTIQINGSNELEAVGGGGGDVTGPASSTDNAVPRFNGTGGKTIENTGVTIDDEDFLVPNGLHIPLHDAGNSGTSKTLDWDDGNEQLLTLTGNVTLTLSNPRDGGRYVLILATGAGGFTVAWPASVLWPDGVAPTITTDADRWDLVTLIYLSGAGVYLGSFNQNYDDDAS